MPNDQPSGDLQRLIDELATLSQRMDALDERLAKLETSLPQAASPPRRDEASPADSEPADDGIEIIDADVVGATRLGFVVEDLGYVLESLWRRGLSPLKKAKQTEWGLRAVVKDPDGRSIELYHGAKPNGDA